MKPMHCIGLDVYKMMIAIAPIESFHAEGCGSEHTVR
jgi:hypothetical protein